MIDFKTQYGLNFEEEINVDLFAGGGGASTGIEMGTNEPIHIAINHDDDAVSMHTANHPGAEHHVSDVFEVNPIAACMGRRVGHLHASPDCTHHSQAAGGQPRKQAIRSLSWVVHKWAGKVRPRIITLENVEQILNWSPLVAKRCKKTGRVIRLDGTVAEKGERVPVHNQFLVPDKRRRGHNWRHFVDGLRRMGYKVEWRRLKACDYGAPTTRERLYLVARCDGLPIAWPKPTHAAKPSRGQKPHRTAAECIDWSIEGQSIFGRKRPLADATMRRIAKGVTKYVLEAAEPFIVQLSYGEGSGKTKRWGDGSRDTGSPLNTITASGGPGVIQPVLVQTGYGERSGQSPRALDIQKPLGTIVACGTKHAVASAYLAQMNGGFNNSPGHDAREPMSTITNTGSQQQLVAASLIHMRGQCFARAADEPLMTISAGGLHHGLLECELSQQHQEGALRCAAFLMEYYSEGGQWGDLARPMNTITTKDRMALVTVWIAGDPYVVVDIKLRMLQPRELYRAQGFPDSYIIDHGHDGRVFPKYRKVHFCGNSVSPLPLAAVARANKAVRESVGEVAA